MHFEIRAANALRYDAKMLLFRVVLAASIAVGALVGTGALVAQTVPTVQAVARDPVPRPRPAASQADRWVGIPGIPPLDEIPPIPMPEPRQGAAVGQGAGPGGVSIHVLETGETITVSGDELEESGAAGESGGYGGVYGALSGNSPATFGAMGIVTDTGQAPFRMNCKLVLGFDRIGGGRDFFSCSGSMVDAEVVLTAGHCVFSQDAVHNLGTNGGFADLGYVLPGWDGLGNSNPPGEVTNEYGWAQANVFAAHLNWIDFGSFDWDLGAIGVTRAAGMLTGYYGLAFGGDCATIMSRTYFNGSYPSEGCGVPGWHNGRRMLFWSGIFDACIGNQVEIFTTPGCVTAVYGGSSGSGYYYDSGGLFVHAVTSNSDREFSARSPVMTEGWFDFLTDTVIPAVRGPDFDLQPLDCDFEPITIAPGDSFDVLNRHVATNPTDNDPANNTYNFDIYLSTNAVISPSDTLLNSQSYQFDFSAMSAVLINHADVTVPHGTSPGTYYVGVQYADGTDINAVNNSTDGWDAVEVQVGGEIPAVANLKLDGQDPPGLVVNVSGPTELTLSMDPGTDTETMTWLLGLIVGNNVFWFTTSGVSLTPAPFVVSPPIALNDLVIVPYNQSAGLAFVWMFLLYDSNGLRSSDFIVAQS